ncbi:hypothetical protein IM40_03195 [Candidatus Paracaedimonas acanthamoebae]|nr:hypothetical protein IM40_03195 [Candidatus Paracaedimonas acanthamoebae]
MTTLSSKDWHQILARGVLTALLFQGFLTNNPLWIVTAIFHQFPLFSVGLQYGVRPLLISSGLSFCCITLLSGVKPALLQSLCFLTPCLLVTSLALHYRQASNKQVKWYPIGRLVASLTAYILGLTAFLTVTLLTNENLQSLQQTLLEGIGKFNHNLEALYRPFIAQLVMILPAFFASFLFLFTLINGILAQSTLQKFSCNLRPTPSMSRFELPWWPWWALAGIGIFAFFGNGTVGMVSINMLWVLLNAFMLEGLAIIHSYSTKYEQRNLFLWIFYTLMVVFGWLALPVLILGIFEPWLNLKERLCKI